MSMCLNSFCYLDKDHGKNVLPMHPLLLIPPLLPHKNNLQKETERERESNSNNKTPWLVKTHTCEDWSGILLKTYFS